MLNLDLIILKVFYKITLLLLIYHQNYFKNHFLNYATHKNLMLLKELSFRILLVFYHVINQTVLLFTKIFSILLKLYFHREAFRFVIIHLNINNYIYVYLLI